MLNLVWTYKLLSWTIAGASSTLHAIAIPRLTVGCHTHRQRSWTGRRVGQARGAACVTQTDLARACAVALENVEGSKSQVLLHGDLNSCCGAVRASSVLVAALVRGALIGRWRLRAVWDPLPSARHFMDCLGDLHRHVLAEVPSSPLKQQVAMILGKGGVLELSLMHQSIRLGFGCFAEHCKADLDAILVLVDDAGEVLEAVFSRDRGSSGPHSRPGAVSLEGRVAGSPDAASGDCMMALVNLEMIGQAVRDIFCFVSAYTRTLGARKTLADIGTPFCRLVEDAPDGGTMRKRHRCIS